MTGRPPLLALLCALPALALAACGGGDEGSSTAPPEDGAAAGIARNPDNARTTIVVGSKNFTEQKVLAEIYARALKEAGYQVRTSLGLEDEQAAQRARRDGRIDGYPEYTGTALLSLCDVPSERVPKDPALAFAEAKECFARDGLTAFEPTPFTSSNEVAVTQETADRLGLRQISDLKAADQDLTLHGSPECRERLDCLRGLRETYGLRFKRFVETEFADRHAVLERGDDVVSIVFTTDPQNKRQGLVLLEDDMGMFPPYNSTFVVRDEVAQRAGADLPKILAQVQAGLTDEVMQELNARVDLDRQSPQQVATEYLQAAKLVAGS